MNVAPDSTFSTIVVQGLLLAASIVVLLRGFAMVRVGTGIISRADGLVDSRKHTLLRVLGVVVLALAAVLLWVSITVYEHRAVVSALAAVVVLAGAARAWAQLQTGPAAPSRSRLIWTEVVLGLAIAVAQWWRLSSSS